MAVSAAVMAISVIFIFVVGFVGFECGGLPAYVINMGWMSPEVNTIFVIFYKLIYLTH